MALAPEGLLCARHLNIYGFSVTFFLQKKKVTKEKLSLNRRAASIHFLSFIFI